MFDIKVQEGRRCWHSEFQKFVREEYNWPEYEVAEEYDYPSNDSYFEFTVDGDSELDEEGDDLVVQVWLETGQTKGIEVEEGWTADVQVKHILHRLFKEGKIPAGDYMMEYWW